jgi:hypothetical protein
MQILLAQYKAIIESEVWDEYDQISYDRMRYESY